ncbi:unnamed protein product [Gongylonema pulchrum]|uniref:Uncharacterized protein n=1 Tax=Gongylonema pulchrum TaxID=637853 RepID=A0A183EKL7_9BILA|nr:unnamed protein product [Gongylonema pulchrum]
MYGGQNGTSESWSLQFPAMEPPVANSPKVRTPVSFGGPLTLIVFGGEAVEATAYFLKENEQIESNPRLAHWKVCFVMSCLKAVLRTGHVRFSLSVQSSLGHVHLSDVMILNKSS